MAYRQVVRGVLIVVGLGAASGHGLAQEAAPPGAPAASAPATPAPDVVMLRSGGLVRGTISELDPAGKVVIVTITGEARTFSMSEVRYAGPVADAPKAKPAPEPPADDEVYVSGTEAPAGKKEFGGAIVERKPKLRPEITVHAREARFDFSSEPDGLTLHKRTSSAIAVGSGGTAVAMGFEEICTAPCEASLPAGSHTFGVSEPGKPAVQADPVTLPAGKSNVSATYNSRFGTRVAGGVIVAAGVVLGTVVMVAANGKETKCLEYTDYCYESSKLNTGTFFAGAGIAVGGSLVGVIMILMPDTAEVQVAGGRSLRRSPGVRVAGTF